MLYSTMNIRLLYKITILSSGECNWLPNNFWKKSIQQGQSVMNWLFVSKETIVTTEDIEFHLFTKKSPDDGFVLTASQIFTLKNSTFNPSSLTTLIIHGWGDSKNTRTIMNLKKALIQHVETNVIVVDWRRLAAQVYFHAALDTYYVGQHISKFLISLKNETGISFDNIHLIGHSLGAQICGTIGYFLNGTISRITALDPAGPLFEFIYVDKPQSLLDASDAKFIDVIHTASDDFGVSKPVGHVDFYPNDGIVPQPGCYSPIAAVSCSHVRSIEFFTESLTNAIEFLARKCPSWTDRIFGYCRNGEITTMGYFMPKNVRGSYYLTTGSEAPFALGMDGIQ